MKDFKPGYYFKNGKLKFIKKNLFARLFCKHDYGRMYKPEPPEFLDDCMKYGLPYFNPDGDEIITFCKKCGHIKSIAFERNFDGS